MDTKLLNIIRGDFTSIPKERTKTVRIFLSSTFSDTHTERGMYLELYLEINLHKLN